MRPLRAAAVLVASGVLGLSACSGAQDPAASPAPTPAETGASVAPPLPDATPATPSASPAPTLAATQCLTGTYRLIRFVAVGGQTYGTGQGGDVTVAFGDDRYTLEGAGQEPVVLTLGGQTGDLTVDGRVRGTYRLADDTATFSDPSATGSGTLSNGSGGTQRLTMKQVDNVIGLAGDGKVACTAQAMTITLNAIRLELGRV